MADPLSDLFSSRRPSLCESKPTRIFLFGRRLSFKSSKEQPVIAAEWKPLRTNSAATNTSFLSTASSFPDIGHGGSAQVSVQSDTSTISGSWDFHSIKVADAIHRNSTASTRQTSSDSCSSDNFLNFVTEGRLEETMEELASKLKQWDSKLYRTENLIEKSISNHGRVDRVRHQHDGTLLAVKRMPRNWMRTSQRVFRRKYPRSLEQPWKDVAMVKLLNELKYPYACKFIGLFREDQMMCVATSLASDGDLCTFCHSGPEPGFAREERIVRLVVQICSAVRYLHDLHVAHLDLSLENVLLDFCHDEPRIRLIDFGMAQVSRYCQPAEFGKNIYRAPELLGKEMFDAFKADSFSVGVTVFTLATQDYPWKSTRASDECPFFTFVQCHGLNRLLTLRKTRQGNKSLASVLSLPLCTLLSGLLELNPSKRLSLGEKCFSSAEATEQKSVWNTSWMNLPVLGGRVVHL